MRKSDLKQFSDLIDERLDLKLDQKLDEKLANFATKDDFNGAREDLKGFATKEDLKRFVTKDDLNESEEKIARSINSGINISLKEFEGKMNIKFDEINKELMKRPTKDEIFQKWDNNIDQIKCDVDGLKYMHRDQWKQLPNRATIKSALGTRNA